MTQRIYWDPREEFFMNEVKDDISTLVVSEVFGPTVQGEGPSVGRQASFLRLGGCNLHCSWCDTPYTWAFSEALAAHHESKKVYDPRKELHSISVGKAWGTLLATAPQRDLHLVVITGGEPMLQARALLPLCKKIREHGWVVEIETAGTIWSDALADIVRFNVSPKLANSRNDKAKRYRPEVLQKFANVNTAFKFVIRDLSDFDEIGEIRQEVKIADNQIWAMVEGTSVEVQSARLTALAQEVIDRGWNISPRLHVQIWGNKRGV